MGDGIEEDAIEATIRRVAAEKAARLAPGERPGADEAEPEVAPEAEATRAAEVARVEMAIRRVATTKATPNAAEAVDPAGAPAPPETTALTVDPVEAAIEATIRRVAEAKAAQRHGHGADAPASAPSADALASAPPSGETPATPPPAAGRSANGGWRPREQRALAERRAPAERRSPAERRAAAEPADSGAGFSREDPDLVEVVAGLRRDLDATRQSLAALAARVDAVTAVTARAEASPKPPATAPDEDGWDDAPTIPRIPLGQPPRPAIFRDPPQHAAAADQLAIDDDEVIIDTRPIPQPLPPLRAEPRRGLDLLPRTYRVTVEDKRRGVDLVPLHRALLGMEGVRDMSLLSYSNGVAMVSLDTLDELDPDALCAAIARAMSRKATVEAHNETMVVKLAEE